MANEEQLAILKQGVDVWNQWRKENPKAEINLREAKLMETNLSQVNLSRAYLHEVKLAGANLSHANFSHADLSEALLREANLNGADLSHANLNDAYLYKANLSKANLREANLTEAIFNSADLSKANLRRANLNKADLGYSNMDGADLRETDLRRALLVRTRVNKAKASGSKVYGISVWDLEGEFKEQKDLVISQKEDATVTVDNVEVAQFVYLLLNNQKIRDVIDTVTTKAVLILGRFYDERKQILDALKEALRVRGFVPILFDFEPSKQRDLTETIQLLANMAKFVIADITDAKSIPQELSHIIPLLPSVPVQPFY